MTTPQEKVENINFPPFITKYSSEHYKTRIQMNLVKKRIPLTEVEAGDYIYLPDGKEETWNKIEQKVGTFPPIANQFIKHSTLQSIPKIGGFPYFCYARLDLSETALYFVVKKAAMVDIVSNSGKVTLEKEYAKRRFDPYPRRNNRYYFT